MFCPSATHTHFDFVFADYVELFGNSLLRSKHTFPEREKWPEFTTINTLCILSHNCTFRAHDYYFTYCKLCVLLLI